MKKMLFCSLLMIVGVLVSGGITPAVLLSAFFLVGATVDGPLFSLEARGKIGEAIVFFPWKGRHAVRRWLKPTNPRDINQKLIRQKLASVGQVIGKIVGVSTAVADGSYAVQEWKTLTPAAQIWNAYIVKKAMTDLSSDNAWTTLMDAIDGADELVTWQSCALDMAHITLFATADPYATDIPPEHQLAAIAYAAYKAGYSDISVDMSVSPELMGTADVSLFVSMMLTDAV